MKILLVSLCLLSAPLFAVGEYACKVCDGHGACANRTCIGEVKQCDATTACPDMGKTAPYTPQLVKGKITQSAK